MLIAMRSYLLVLCAAPLFASTVLAQSKAPLTIDDLFSFTDIRSARLAPDGNAAVIETARADWKRNRFREDLWLWRRNSPDLLALTQSGHDSDPQWAPDGKHIAFISDRLLEPAASPDDDKAEKQKEIARVWIIDPSGGEAFPLYREELKVHAFAWTRDSSAIVLSVPEPLSKDAQEAKEREWKDVSRWRDDDRGDVLIELSARKAAQAIPAPPERTADKNAPPVLPKDSRVITRSNYAVNEIAPAPDGSTIAFLTNSISGRLEHTESYEVYLASLRAAAESAATQLTHNQALERQLHWSPDGDRLYFGVFAASGSLEGSYRDVQGRLYMLNIASKEIERVGKSFAGSWTDYSVLPDGRLLALGQLGTEVHAYLINDRISPLGSRSGTYEGLEISEHGRRLLYRHSAIDEPTELFLADDALDPESARPVTHFNTLFTQRDLPRMKTYRWRAKDGKTIEGVLLYPPGKFGQRNLRMLTLIHGGPADADGNKFGADWYDWALLAAAQGWLVFQPNYRGSTGYGDEFMTAISPHIVSLPGADILTGVDALVKDGTADPAHLAVGGYSYGGYLTNWLLTQTTRFRSALTGAGAVEHASNWGNDDLTLDDAWYLGGLPWQIPATYQGEAALFQFDRVKTPVHEVIGADDVRVSASQGYLLERALDTLHIPHQFLIFPGEGHALGKNPWHGYIKVREELKWIEKYDRTGL